MRNDQASRRPIVHGKTRTRQLKNGAGAGAVRKRRGRPRLPKTGNIAPDFRSLITTAPIFRQTHNGLPRCIGSRAATGENHRRSAPARMATAFSIACLAGRGAAEVEPREVRHTAQLRAWLPAARHRGRYRPGRWVRARHEIGARQ